MCGGSGTVLNRKSRTKPIRIKLAVKKCVRFSLDSANTLIAQHTHIKLSVPRMAIVNNPWYNNVTYERQNISQF